MSAPYRFGVIRLKHSDFLGDPQKRSITRRPFRIMSLLTGKTRGFFLPIKLDFDFGNRCGNTVSLSSEADRLQIRGALHCKNMNFFRPNHTHLLTLSFPFMYHSLHGITYVGTVETLNLRVTYNL